MWKELFRIKSKAKTAEGIRRAIEKATGWDMTTEEVESMIRNSWIEAKGNYIIVWQD